MATTHYLALEDVSCVLPDGTPLFSPDEDWPDPWVAIGAMSSVTTTLRFLTNVYVLFVHRE